jgi:hypothetical protein
MSVVFTVFESKLLHDQAAETGWQDRLAVVGRATGVLLLRLIVAIQPYHE